jgi:uncharacterized protein
LKRDFCKYKYDLLLLAQVLARIVLYTHTHTPIFSSKPQKYKTNRTVHNNVSHPAPYTFKFFLTMADIVAIVLQVIGEVLKSYESVQTFQEEAQQFRRILRTSRSILGDVKLQLENNPYRVTSLAESMDQLKAAVETGKTVFEKCVGQQSSQRRLKQFVFTKKYIEKLAEAGNRIQSALGMLSAAGVVIQGDVLEGVDELKKQNTTLQLIAQTYHNEILDQLERQSTLTEALPHILLQELIKLGVVSNRQDYTLQMEDIAKEARELHSDRRNFNTHKVQVDEFILLADNAIVQMVEQLSLNESNKVYQQAYDSISAPKASPPPSNNELNALLQCPISLDRMQDPVTLFPSGHTFDKKSICVWLLTNPDCDPMSQKKYDTPMSIADNISLRQLLMQQHGDTAYVKYDDSVFQNEYLIKWNACRECQKSARRAGTNDQLYKKISDLEDSCIAGKEEDAFNLAFTEPYDPVCLGFAALMIDPKNKGSFYPCKDTVRANDLWHRADQHGLTRLVHEGEKPWALYVEGLRQKYILGNESMAVDWFRRAAVGHNLAQAQLYLGVMYLSGKGVMQDSVTAVEWIRRAAEQGNPGGQYVLGLTYLNGYGVTTNHTVAAEWYQRAADKGLAVAQYNLGTMYENGHGVSQSYTTALEWYRHAADQGYTKAQRKLETIHEGRCELNHASQPGTNIQLYKKISDLEDSGIAAKEEDAFNLAFTEPYDPVCLGFAALMIDPKNSRGAHPRKDADQANDLWQRANHYGLTRVAQEEGKPWALYVEGLRQKYILGKKSLAVDCFRRAALDHNLAQAQAYLGAMYLLGEGVLQDSVTAVEWIRRAAEQGNSGGQYGLGLMYFNGCGVTTNHTVAAEWYQRAADKGLAEAQYNLGTMYENGDGVSQSYKTALELYRLGADQGHAKARKKLNCPL